MDYQTFGRHVAIDAWGVEFQKLNNVEMLKSLMVKSAERHGATVLSVQSKQFEPQGATVLVLLSESHVSIHTYPEKGFAALDCYTCGDTINPQMVIDDILTVLEPENIYDVLLVRGTGEIEVKQKSEIITK